MELSSPLQIRQFIFRNRMVGLPVGFSQSIDSTATPTERMIAMYRRRAQGGAAMITIEATFVEPPPYRPSKWGLPGFYSDSQTPQYTNLTDAIRAAGSLSALQVFDKWHSDFPYEMNDLSASDIEAMIDSYVRAAARARAAGFDAITFQMAHGWPLSRFASPLTNHRKDKYGDFPHVGSEVIRRSRHEVGNDILLIARMNIMEERHGKAGVTIEQAAKELAPAFERAGADILDLTFGLGPIARNHHDYWMSEHVYDPPGDKFRYYESIKKAVRAPIVGRSGVNDPKLARRIVESEIVDLLGIGRQLLADPDFPRKSLEGCDDTVVRCIRCGFCGRGTLGSAPMRCAVNGSLGREIDAREPVPWKRRPKKVFIVGGGPAGMQAAVAMAKQGCSVTLFEKEEQLGGLVRLVSRLPKLRLLDLRYAIEDLGKEIETLPIELRLSTNFAMAHALGEKADVIVMATGSVPASSGAATRSAGISLSYLDYLNGRQPGRRVLIDGHGEGAEFAVSLARAGHQVVLVEQSSRLEATAYDYARKRVFALADYLTDEKVETFWNSRVKSVQDQKVEVESDGVTAIEVDSVLVAGRTPFRMSATELRLPSAAMLEIGDCVSPRGIGEALEEGRRIAEMV